MSLFSWLFGKSSKKAPSSLRPSSGDDTSSWIASQFAINSWIGSSGGGGGHGASHSDGGAACHGGSDGGFSGSCDGGGAGGH